MAAIIVGKVWGLDLPHNKLLILLALADHADHEGNNVYPSLGLIAWKTGYSEQQVRRVMRLLEQDGILVATNKTPGKATRYRIDLSAGKPKPSRNTHQNVTPDKKSPLTFGTQTPDITMSPESYNHKQPPQSGGKFPKDVSKWNATHTGQYYALNTDNLDRLLQSWFVLRGAMRPMWKEMTISEQRCWVVIHRDLTAAGWTEDQYGGLAAFTQTKWKDAPPKHMLSVASEYRASLASARLRDNGGVEGRRGVRLEDSISYYLPPAEAAE